MKELIISALIGIGLIIGSFFYGKSTIDCTLPDSKVIVERSYLDSLNNVANSKPDTVTIIDTLYIDKVIEVEKPASTSDSIVYTYTDSVVTDTVKIYQNIDFNSNSKVFKSKLKYTLNIPTVVKEITHKVPMPYEVEKIVYRMDEAWYFTGNLGVAVNDGTIVPMLGLIRVNDGNGLYGLSAGSLEDNLFLNFTYGLKIK